MAKKRSPATSSGTMTPEEQLAALDAREAKLKAAVEEASEIRRQRDKIKEGMSEFWRAELAKTKISEEIQAQMLDAVTPKKRGRKPKGNGDSEFNKF